MLRLNDFMQPLRTELQSDRNFCRIGGALQWKRQRARTVGNVCDRGKLSALRDLQALGSRDGPGNAVKLARQVLALI